MRLMVAMSWGNRLARLPLPEEQVIEGLARAIYTTHQNVAAPTWDNAGDNVRRWVRAQALEGLAFLRTLERPSK
jgi:hypothetical protein